MGNLFMGLGMKRIVVRFGLGEVKEKAEGFRFRECDLHKEHEKRQSSMAMREGHLA
eukprot:CAMPEP_0178455846 /NCGR_PEP_ID=MMETSP0689_2-20121128/46131_1 /TAXON_ID=160604 /ORGANISM="Amphidinium massartii, Strain CS-259" /LENGTH=55 /DNA_ID=CAMNT_0020081917 /DNA_START=412 /DNA_END=579 /DNA_ORIENTATION=+